MTNQDSSEQQQPGTQQGFPIQLKILAAIIVLSLLALIIKVAGIV
jgi:hypothetical protein